MRKPIRHAHANNLAATKRSIVTISGVVALVLGTTSVGPSLASLPANTGSRNAARVSQDTTDLTVHTAEQDSLTRKPNIPHQRMLVFAPQKTDPNPASQPFLPPAKTKGAGEIIRELGAAKTNLVLEITQKNDTTIPAAEPKPAGSTPETPTNPEAPVTTPPDEQPVEPTEPAAEPPVTSEPEQTAPRSEFLIAE